MKTERKLIVLTLEEREKLNLISSYLGINPNAAISSMIRNFKVNDEVITIKDKSTSPKGYYVRLYKDDDLKLTEIARSKGVTVPQEIRFRVSSTMGQSTYDQNEAKILLSVAQDIAKVGRLINQAIKEDLLIGSRHTTELSSKINELEAMLKTVFTNTMQRLK